MASGTIEADTVAITAELGGRITELKVDEGDEVMAGQVLVELDRADLQAQQTQLGAALLTARANLEWVSAPPQSEEIAAARAQLDQAQAVRDGARQTWRKAKALVDAPHALDARISRARAGVTDWLVVAMSRGSGGTTTGGTVTVNLPVRSPIVTA